MDGWFLRTTEEEEEEEEEEETEERSVGLGEHQHRRDLVVSLGAVRSRNRVALPCGARVRCSGDTRTLD